MCGDLPLRQLLRCFTAIETAPNSSFSGWEPSLAGAYEYICSVFTEAVFGTVFWDYSDIPFNLAGRINLLYCFFWGFAAVAWFKILYPRVSRLIEKIPVKPGKIITWLLLIFMLADGVVSSAALARYNTRSNGIEASNSFESWVDEHFDDARMARIYSKGKAGGIKSGTNC